MSETEDTRSTEEISDEALNYLGSAMGFGAAVALLLWSVVEDAGLPILLAMPCLALAVWCALREERRREEVG